MRSERSVRNFCSISVRDFRVGCDLRKSWNAFRAVCGSCEICEGVAESLVKIGLLVDGDMVVIFSVPLLEVVSPLLGCVDVLSCVILAISSLFCRVSVVLAQHTTCKKRRSQNIQV